MAAGLLTDLYELNMAASYLRRGMEAQATFSLFVRQLPADRGFLVAAGLDSCLDFLEDFRFDGDDLSYLRDVLRFRDGDLRAFAAMRFTGDVWAVPEGRVVFANEPLLEVTAPIAQAQLVETYLLNQVTFQTAIASKAARCRLAARGRDLVDFAFRRTHGVDAAMAVARSSAIAGFVATSNVEAARRYGLRTSGTMAHSYVEAFPGERDAFLAFSEDFPTATTFLVDTYDTVAGVQTAIAVARERGLVNVAVRLDSGDLVELSCAARRLLDAAGLTNARIVASGGLDELDIEALLSGGAPIDAFGVGTKMGVSADAPSLDSVYKLVAYGGRPMLKLSPGKATAPGAKQVFRHPGTEGDVIGLREESIDGWEPLLAPVMRAGRRASPRDTIDAARARFDHDVERLPASALQLVRPVPPRVRFSAVVERLAERLSRALRPGAHPVP